MAYLQVAMKERVFVKMPAYWAQLLPASLHHWIGRPLLLLKALYGYTYSGKFLYDEQAEFLSTTLGFTKCKCAPALWYKNLPDNGLSLALQYSDDILMASTNPAARSLFVSEMTKRFDIEHTPRATWYLQAQVQQDSSLNITIDQTRYAKSIVKRYLPNASYPPSAEDIATYSAPLPYDFKWHTDDCSVTDQDVLVLEKEFGFRLIEVAGSLNYLSNTAIACLFAIRKLCRFTRKPGLPHFKATSHLLHHIRCCPPSPLVYYHEVHTSPLFTLLKAASVPQPNSSIHYFTDSSWQDCPDGRSTGCFLGFFQGGLIDFNSVVPSPVALSSAEAEVNILTIGTVSSLHSRMIIMEILTGNPDSLLTIPFYTDSSAALSITANERTTQRTRHIERRYLFCRDAHAKCYIDPFHVKGEDFQLADIGTKNLAATKLFAMISLITADSPPDK